MALSLLKWGALVGRNSDLRSLETSFEHWDPEPPSLSPEEDPCADQQDLAMLLDHAFLDILNRLGDDLLDFEDDEGEDEEPTPITIH